MAYNSDLLARRVVQTQQLEVKLEQETRKINLT